MGTVCEVGKAGSSSSPEKTVVVQWDSGFRTNYRVGYQGQFDLRVIDNAQIGRFLFILPVIVNDNYHVLFIIKCLYFVYCVHYLSSYSKQNKIYAYHTNFQVYTFKIITNIR